MTGGEPRRVPVAVWRIAAVASLGPLMTNLDSTVVNVALAPLGQALHAPFAAVQWVASGYLLALALSLPVSGWLVARWGTRHVYLLAFGGFTVASGLCATAPTIGWLVVARLLQGVFGGLLTPLAQLTIARAAGPLLSRVMGVAVIPVLLGPIFGPALGGGILAIADWRWLFLVNLPFGALALALAFWLLPGDPVERSGTTLDIVGLLMLSPAFALLLIGLDRLGSEGPLAAGLIGLGLLLLIGFLRRAGQRRERSLIDVDLLRTRRFAIAAVLQFLANGVMLGGQVLLPVLLLGNGLRPGEVGLLLGATGIGAVVSYPLCGRLVDRLGPRMVLAGGALLTLAGTLPFLATQALSPWLAAAALFMRGLGIGGLTLPPISVAYKRLAPEDLPPATTTLNIAQRLGGPVAATALGVLVSHAGGAAAVLSLSGITLAMLAGAAVLPG